MACDPERPPSTRRAALLRGGVLSLVLAAALLFLGSSLAESDTEKERPMVSTSFQQMFDHSRSEKKGLVLFVKGQTIAGLVTSYSDEVVEMRSQQYERIVVRVDRIDALASQ